MTLPAMTLQQLRLAAQQRADMVGSDFVTDAEWSTYINDSLYALYDALIAAQPIGYYSTLPPYSFTTDGTSQYYALPSDFYKLQGVDLALSSAQNGFVTLKPFNFAERNRFGMLGGSMASIGSVWSALRYRLLGNNLQLTPVAQAGQTVQVWYVPKLTPMVEIATITLTGFGRTNTNGANLVTTGAELVFDGYDGDDEPIDLSLYASQSLSAAATAIASAITTAYGTAGTVAVLSITATASGNVITLTVPSGARAISYSSTTDYAACSSSTIAYGTTSFDGFSGWLAWVYLDAARKALVKEESDTSAVERDLAVLNDRIGKMASTRDVGSPSSVVDVHATGNGWLGGYGED